MTLPPVRLRLSRKPGADIAAVSQAVNGRGARSVIRPGPYGNPFVVDEGYSAADAKRDYERWIYQGDPDLIARAKKLPPAILKIQQNLRGRNLFCTCTLCARHKAGGLPRGEACADCPPCHADVLLIIANPEYRR